MKQHVHDVPLCAFAAFVATVAAMPVLNDGYNPVQERISQAVLGAYGFVQVAGILALAAGAFLVATQLTMAAASRPVRLTATCIMLSAACVVLVAAIPTDPPGGDTVHGNAHLALAVGASIANIAAMLYGARAFRREACVCALAWPSLAFGITSVVLLSMMGLGLGPAGLVQRTAVAVQVVWLALITWNLRLTKDQQGVAGLPARTAGAAR
jgi:hypothetical protein